MIKKVSLISIVASTILSSSAVADFNISAITGGVYNTLILESNGSVWGFGVNSYGGLGDGTTTKKYAPVEANTTSATGFSVNNTPVDLNISKISSYGTTSTGRHTIALEANGTLWAWGYNSDGQLGNGNNTNSNNPVEVNTTSATGFSVNNIPTDLNITTIATGYTHVLALEANGTLWAWGKNDYGQLGDGNQTDSSNPVEVNTTKATGFAVYKNGSWIDTDLNITAVSAGQYFSFGVEANGTVWAWGKNGFGQLGDGTQSNSNNPVEVNTTSATGFSVNNIPTNLNITAISAGISQIVALEANGTIWAWGQNNNGQLGDGTQSNSNNPVEVNTTRATGFSVNGTPTDLNITAISTGYARTLALEANGSLWAWGYNGDGELGDGTTIASNNPVEVNLSTSKGWYYDANITSIKAGYSHSLALDVNGTLLGWGNDTHGQLGDGSTTSSKNPIIIGANPRDVTFETTRGVISWKKPFYRVNHYSLYRATSSSGPYTTLSSSVEANATTYTDTTATTEVTDYYYIVTAHYTQFGTFTEANSTNTTIAGNSYGQGNWFVADTTPNAFTFTDLTNQELSTSVTSSQITISGINQNATISISGEGCEYLISQAGRRSLRAPDTYTNASGVISNGKSVNVRVTSSASYSTKTDCTLTIGGVSDTFSVTTKDAPVVQVQTSLITSSEDSTTSNEQKVTQVENETTYTTTANLKDESGNGSIVTLDTPKEGSSDTTKNLTIEYSESDTTTNTTIQTDKDVDITVNIDGSFVATKSFEDKKVIANGDSKGETSIDIENSNSKQNINIPKGADVKIENNIAKVIHTLKAETKNNISDMKVEIEADPTKSIKVVANYSENGVEKTTTYSTPSDVIEAIVDFIQTKSGEAYSGIKATIKTSKKLSFSTNKREVNSESIEVVGTTSWQKYDEKVYFDGRRTITLILGGAKIIRDGVEEVMLKGVEYDIPSNVSENTQTVDTSNDKLTPIYINSNLNMIEGWNLIANPTNAPIEISNLSAKVAFKYSSGWIKEPTILSSDEGMWVKYDSNMSEKIEGEEYYPNFANLTNGWNLLGVGRDTALSELSEFSQIWAYNSSTKEWIENPSIIYRGYGFWAK